MSPGGLPLQGLTDTKITSGGSPFSAMSVLRTPAHSDLGHAFSQHSLHRSVSQLIDRKSLMEAGSWDNPAAQDPGLVRRRSLLTSAPPRAHADADTA